MRRSTKLSMQFEAAREAKKKAQAVTVHSCMSPAPPSESFTWPQNILTDLPAHSKRKQLYHFSRLDAGHDEHGVVIS